jgi:hypothetical protein
MKKIFFILLFFSGACKQAYVPPVKPSNTTSLVVEGFINNGSDSTYISLTHTFNLNDTSHVTPELHAQLTVEGKDNSSYPLTEWGGGQYGAASLVLNNALPYRLHIHTAAGKEYVSDYLDLKTSPPIDSIGWLKGAAGVQVYANTHDPQSASHYYRWDYQETWEFNSAYLANIQYVNGQLVNLFPDTYYTCWKSGSSTTILLGSSTKLSTDEIYQAPLVLLPSHTWKLGIRYSILVHQYVLTADAFNFWQQMQKNTEQIGSIFSPQPSEAKGNLHSLTDSSEGVVGFISAGTLRQKRIFITPDQLGGWRIDSLYSCAEFSIPTDSVNYFVGQRGYAPIDAIIGNGPTRYDISTPECVNCTLTGTNVKPSFWP